MIQDFYADGIGQITLAGGMVRMDLITLASTGKADSKDQKFDVKHRVIMPPDGFLKSFSAMENLVKQLIDAGLVKPRDSEGGSA